MKFGPFIEKWAASSGAERANKDLFFAELCDVLEIPRPNPVTGDPEVDTYVFEADVPFVHDDGRRSVRKIDVYRKGVFLLEAKQGSTATSSRLGSARRKTDAWNVAMHDAFGQALGYARCIDNPPPFLVVSDIGYCFDLYACFDGSSHWTPFPNAQLRRIYLHDLEKHADTLRAVFTDPYSLDPSRIAARVTREVASHLAELANILEKSGHAGDRVARFLMRCLFTMFAEDVGLLPPRLFTDSIEKHWLPHPEDFVGGVEHLWKTMNEGGTLYLVGNILRFNGGLFREAEGLPLDRQGLEILLEAAHCDWSGVEPAIFGALLERALDPKERHRLGAHYTPRAYVERLVRPTIEEPIREEWDLVRAEVRKVVDKGLDASGETNARARKKAVKLLKNFHQHLVNIRVLDPACGSGNFLYVTLDLFMEIESEVLALLLELGEEQELLGLKTIRVSPGQFLGIEVKPWAKEIAELVLWIGYFQWHFRAYKSSLPIPEPVLSDYKNIECRDALIEHDGEEPVLDPHTGKTLTRWDGETMKPHPVTGELVPDERATINVTRLRNPRKAEWPKADFIVGNPPFLGKLRMLSALGECYVRALREVYAGVIPDSADFVMYWWGIAADKVARGDALRSGLVTTNSIKQIYNRRVVTAALTEGKPAHIAFAIPDHPWVDDGASVRIAMTVVASGSGDGTVASVVRESDSGGCGTAHVEFETVRGVVNADLTVGANVVSALALRAMEGLASAGVMLGNRGFRLSKDERLNGPSSIIRPIKNGADLLQRDREGWVIDFHGFTVEEARRAAPEALQQIIDKVKPERDKNRRAARRERWWLFAETMPNTRRIINGLDRYIATPETSKHRIFTFLSGSTLPEHPVLAIGLNDGYFLGVLSSRVHIAWALAAGARLGVGNDARYNKTRCFETFPFPEVTDEEREHIRKLAEEIDELRKTQQAVHDEVTLTGVYNVLETLRRGEDLNRKEAIIHEQGLVSVLNVLHDALDTAVFDAYGWSDLGEVLVGCPGATTPFADKTKSQVEAEGELLRRLVALNAERAGEEGRGHVRWLRPELQAAGSIQTTAEFATKSNERAALEEAPISIRKLAWPESLPNQLATARAEIKALPQPFQPSDLAKRYTKAKIKDVEAVLDCLAALGLVLHVEGPDSTPAFATVDTGIIQSTAP